MPDQPLRTICLTLGIRAAAFPDGTSDRRKRLPAFWQCLTAPSLFCSSAAGSPAIQWTSIQATGTGTGWDEPQSGGTSVMESLAHMGHAHPAMQGNGCWVISLGVSVLSLLILCALHFQIRITALVTDISKMCFAPAGFSCLMHSSEVLLTCLIWLCSMNAVYDSMKAKHFIQLVLIIIIMDTCSALYSGILPSPFPAGSDIKNKYHPWRWKFYLEMLLELPHISNLGK